MRVLLVVSVVLAVVGTTSAALAQTGSAEQPPEVQGGGFPNENGGSDVGPSGVGPSEFGGFEGGQLPFTGAQVTVLALVGLAAIGSGVALVRRTRASGERS
jgi:LPXTG-motif cell wall-anchored protein